MSRKSLAIPNSSTVADIINALEQRSDLVDVLSYKLNESCIDSDCLLQYKEDVL